MRIISWNVNGIRAALGADKREKVQAWVRAEAPDVLCFQEIRIDEVELAKGAFASAFEALPHAAFACCTTQKGYAGTATFSREKPLRVLKGFAFHELGEADTADALTDTEGRILVTEFAELFVVNVYVPNSGMKLENLEMRTKTWDPAFRRYILALQKHKPVVVIGDLNVAFHDMDLHSPKTNRNKTPGFCDAERDNFAALLAAGFHDVWRERNPALQQFTYWSARFNCRANNKGWRLDYALTSEVLVPRVVRNLGPYSFVAVVPSEIA